MPEPTDQQPQERRQDGGVGPEGLGFKFNQVQGEEPAREIIVPQIDAATRSRRLLFIGLAVIAIVLLLFVSRNRLGVVTVGGEAKPNTTFRPPQDRRLE